MKILVTGGMGFIGHNVVAQLEQLGHDVEIIDAITTYGIIPADEINFLIGERRTKTSAKVHVCDITSIAVKTVFESFKPDIVIHLASFPRQRVVNSNPVLGSKTMIEGLINLCELSKTNNVKKFVYVSSSMVYGDFDNNINEDAVCFPKGQYGIMKLTGEWLVKDYAARGCFDYTIVRPSAVYGPRDVEDRVVSRFFLSAMRGETLKVNGETETLDFTYVDDAADGIIKASLNPTANQFTYNITRGRSRTLLEAAHLIVNIVGKGNIKTSTKDSEYPSRGALDIQRAQVYLGFDPKIDIEEGFKRYYDYLKNSPFWSTKTIQ
jgi:nucleoside-diphosphate-sugar epimerase